MLYNLVVIIMFFCFLFLVFLESDGYEEKRLGELYFTPKPYHQDYEGDRSIGIVFFIFSLLKHLKFIFLINQRTKIHYSKLEKNNKNKEKKVM